MQPDTVPKLRIEDWGDKLWFFFFEEEEEQEENVKNKRQIKIHSFISIVLIFEKKNTRQ